MKVTLKCELRDYFKTEGLMPVYLLCSEFLDRGNRVVRITVGLGSNLSSCAIHKHYLKQGLIIESPAAMESII